MITAGIVILEGIFGAFVCLFIIWVVRLYRLLADHDAFRRWNPPPYHRLKPPERGKVIDTRK